MLPWHSRLCGICLRAATAPKAGGVPLEDRGYSPNGTPLPELVPAEPGGVAIVSGSAARSAHRARPRRYGPIAASPRQAGGTGAGRERHCLAPHPRPSDEQRANPKHTRNRGARCFLFWIGVFLQMNTPLRPISRVPANEIERRRRKMGGADQTGVFLQVNTPPRRLSCAAAPARSGRDCKPELSVVPMGGIPVPRRRAGEAPRRRGEPFGRATGGTRSRSIGAGSSPRPTRPWCGSPRPRRGTPTSGTRGA
jgi:hypothetical protein